jgi:hypothetical protein
MTTAALEPGRSERAFRRVLTTLSATLHVFAGVAGAKARASHRHLQDHAYTICGLGLVASAAFVHSVFTGLLITGLLFLVFEWKVSE